MEITKLSSRLWLLYWFNRSEAVSYIKLFVDLAELTDNISRPTGGLDLKRFFEVQDGSVLFTHKISKYQSLSIVGKHKNRFCCTYLDIAAKVTPINDGWRCLKMNAKTEQCNILNSVLFLQCYQFSFILIYCHSFSQCPSIGSHMHWTVYQLFSKCY